MRTVNAVSNCACTDHADVAVFTIEYIPPYRFAQFKTAMDRLETNRGKDFCLTLAHQLNEMAGAPTSLKNHVTRFLKERNIAEVMKMKSESPPAEDTVEVVEEEEAPPQEEDNSEEEEIEEAKSNEQDTASAIKKSVANLQSVAEELHKTVENFKSVVAALEINVSKQKQRDDVEKKIADSETNIVELLKSLMQVLPSKSVLDQLQEVEIAGQTADATNPPKTIEPPPKRGFIRRLARTTT